MRRPLQIGITGGIGSGKSLVCRIFVVLGVPVYDADSRAKKLMTTDGILIDQIKKEFGTLSYFESGELNREYLSANVFVDKEKLKLLNSLVHPRVGVDYENWASAHHSAPYVIKEAALLFESGSYKSLDSIIVVAAPDDLRMKRVLARDRQRTEENIRNIMTSQLAESEKKSRADYIIHNDEQQLLVPQVLKLHGRFNSDN